MSESDFELASESDIFMREDSDVFLSGISDDAFVEWACKMQELKRAVILAAFIGWVDAVVLASP